MIATGTLSISLVEGEGFEELVGYFKHEYVMPLRSTVSKHIETHFEGKNDKLKVKLGWTSKF